MDARGVAPENPATMSRLRIHVDADVSAVAMAHSGPDYAGPLVTPFTDHVADGTTFLFPVTYNAADIVTCDRRSIRSTSDTTTPR